MPKIQFTEDVGPGSQHFPRASEGSYRKGAVVEVSEASAGRWERRGIAVRVADKTKVTAKYVEDLPPAKPKAKPAPEPEASAEEK